MAKTKVSAETVRLLHANGAAISVSRDKARRLVAGGQFTEAKGTARSAEPVDLSTEEGLNTLTVAELKELAAEREVDLTGAGKKPDIVAALLAPPSDDGEGA